MSVDFTSLDRRMSGRVLAPADDEFAVVRKWFIGRMSETLPLAVARCRTKHDVAAAVKFARDAGISFAMRSGAHSFAEYSMCDGLVIDLEELDDITVTDDVVTTGPGVRIAGMAQALAEHNRLIPFGWCTMVAVAGASMGGGFGPLGRYYGLACDHLTEAEVVLADGQIVRAAADEEPDLLWALRGAGAGNFGAVTSLTFRSRPTVPAIDFAAWWPAEHAASVIAGWQHWAPHASSRLNAELVLRCWPDLAEEPILVVFGLMVDTTVAEAKTHLSDLTDLIGTAPRNVSYTAVSAKALPEHHTFGGEPIGHLRKGGRPAEAEPGVRFVKSEFFDGPMPSDAAEDLAEWLLRDREASQQRELEFIPWGGKIGEPAPDDTAFVHRSPQFLLEHTVQAYGPTDLKKASHEWVSRSKEIVSPWGNGRVYQNYPDPDLTDWEHAYYGSNLDRLRRVKSAYDPDNVFRYQQSIRADVD